MNLLDIVRNSWRRWVLKFNKINKITPFSIKKNINEILEHTAEQDHVTVELEEIKQLVGKDLDKHIKTLNKKMLDYKSF